MNDATSGTHADTEALAAERAPDVRGDDGDPDILENAEFPDVEDDGIIVDLDPNSAANKGFMN